MEIDKETNDNDPWYRGVENVAFTLRLDNELSP